MLVGAGGAEVHGIDVHQVVTAADAENAAVADLLVDAELLADHVRLEAQMVAAGLLAVEHAEGVEPHRAGRVGVLLLADFVALAGTVANDARETGRIVHGGGILGRQVRQGRGGKTRIDLAGAAAAEIPAQAFGHVLGRAVAGRADGQVGGRTELVEAMLKAAASLNKKRLRASA